MSSPSITTTPFPPSRDDNTVKLRRQEAANALQRYPVLALHAVRNGEVTFLGYSIVLISMTHFLPTIVACHDASQVDEVNYKSMLCIYVLVYSFPFSMMSNRPLQPSHATVKYKKGGVARASSSSDAS